MQRPIRPDWLLRQADELGYRHAGAGQPRNSDLRRAVSAAYYAIFHRVVGAAAVHLLPGGSLEEQQRVGRSLTHQNLRLACEYLTKPGGHPVQAAPIALAASTNTALLDVAEAILTLQEARHRADYDHLSNFTKAGVLQLVDQARDGIAKVDALEGAPDMQRFITLLVLRQVLR